MPSTAAAVAERNSPATVSFSLTARAEPGVMPRVLELFAKRGLVPLRFSGAAAPEASLAIDIEVNGLDRDTADYVARCMRQISGVNLVLTA
jgi:acetolactate synthase small subunit